MIKLEVKEYCHGCTEFDPDIKRPETLYVGNESYTSIGDTIIRCEHREKCDRIREFCSKSVKGEN